MRVSAVLLFLVMIGRSAGASPACEGRLPPNVDGGALVPTMLRLLEGSETFRQQCERIALVPSLHIAIRIGHQMPSDGRAETVIGRYRAGAIRAAVDIRFGQDYAELIPHELEHVLEQLDGVRLRDEVKARRAWRLGSGAFETKRAIAAGLQVRQELEASALEAVQADSLKRPGPRHPFD